MKIEKVESVKGQEIFYRMGAYSVKAFKRYKPNTHERVRDFQQEEIDEQEARRLLTEVVYKGYADCHPLVEDN